MKLILSIDLIRHADRTPIHCIPGVSEDITEDNLGKLTSAGERNAIKLGEKLKQYYIEDHSLLPDSHEPETILIRSSDFQRTKKTAKCIMEGMYNSQLEGVSIKILPKEKDMLFLGFLYGAGKEMHNIIRQQYANSTKFSEDVVQEIGLELKKINNKLGTNFNDIVDIVKIADVIRTDSIYKEFLSKEIGKKGITKILHLAKLVLKDVFENPEVACAGAGALIKKVMNKMTDKMQGQTSLRYILFSGHDTNLLSAMSLLDLPLVEVPYLANLRFELFQDDNGQFFVKFFCLDRYVQIHSEEYCPFNKFEFIINDKLNRKHLESKSSL